MLPGGRPPTHFLEVRDLRVQFPTQDGMVRSVDGLSFELERGQTLGIVGESGSGKSVTSLSIMGLHERRAAQLSGEIWLDGEELLGMTPEQVRRLRGKKMAMIFQDPLSAMHPYYTVGEQIVEAYRIHTDVSKREAHRHAVDMLGRVGIPQPASRVDDYPHQFSGGMRQRAMIAMALSCNPDLLIADEPTTALDVTVQAQILDLIRDLQAEFDSAVIIITHDLGVVAEIADDILVMYAGRAAEYSRAEDVFRRPEHPYTWGLLGSMPRLDRARRAAADPGRRHPAEPDQRAAGLRVPPALPVRGADGRGRAHRRPADAPVRAWPPGGLPPAGRDPAPDLGDRDRAPAGRGRRGGVVTTAPDVSPPAPSADADGALLAVSGLQKHFPIRRGVIFARKVGAVQAVDGLDFDRPAGARRSRLVGESGCGKTTTGRLLTRLLEPTDGSIVFDGRDISHLSVGKMRPLRREIQMIFQDPYSSLNPRHTVGAIVGAPYRLQKVQTERGTKREVQDLLELVGLNPEHYNRYPHEFSGGQRQRIGIARTLALRPRLIVADEPVSALDVSIQAQVINLLEDLQDELGLTYVVIAHDLSVVRHMSRPGRGDVPGQDRRAGREGRASTPGRCTRTRWRCSRRSRCRTRSDASSGTGSG